MVAISNTHYKFFPRLFAFFFIEFQNSWDTLYTFRISRGFLQNTPRNTKHLLYTVRISCKFRVLLMPWKNKPRNPSTFHVNAWLKWEMCKAKKGTRSTKKRHKIPRYTLFIFCAHFRVFQDKRIASLMRVCTVLWCNSTVKITSDGKSIDINSIVSITLVDSMVPIPWADSIVSIPHHDTFKLEKRIQKLPEIFLSPFYICIFSNFKKIFLKSTQNFNKLHWNWINFIIICSVGVFGIVFLTPRVIVPNLILGP